MKRGSRCSKTSRSEPGNVDRDAIKFPKMLVKVFGKLGDSCSITSVEIDDHEMTKSSPVSNNALFERSEDFVIDGCTDFAFIRNMGNKMFCKSVWMHDTQKVKVVGQSARLPITAISGAFGRNGEYYAYGYKNSADHNSICMELARLGGSTERLFDYSSRLWAVKPATVVDYYGRYMYMGIKTDNNIQMQSNIDFVRTKVVLDISAMPIAAFGDSAYWFHPGGFTVHTDWRSGKNTFAPNIHSSMQNNFSTTLSMIISSATYIDDMRFMVHDNVSSVFATTHIAVFDLRNLTEVCCGYRLTEAHDGNRATGRCDTYMRIGNLATGSSPTDSSPTGSSPTGSSPTGSSPIGFTR